MSGAALAGPGRNNSMLLTISPGAIQAGPCQLALNSLLISDKVMGIKPVFNKLTLLPPEDWTS